jgi:hypothetical protein
MGIASLVVEKAEGRRQTAAKLYRDRDPPFGVAVNQGQGPWPWQRRLEA